MSQNVWDFQRSQQNERQTQIEMESFIDDKSHALFSCVSNLIKPTKK